MFGKLIEPEIHALIRERNFAALREIFSDWPPADLAELIADLPEEDQVVIFRMLPHAMASRTFEYLGLHAEKRPLHARGCEDVARVINGVSADRRTGLLEELAASP